MRLAGRVDDCGEKVLLDDLACIDASEGSNLLLMLVGVHLDHFPSEEDFDVPLLALFESNLVGIWELEDLLVRCPILHSGILCCTALHDILSDKVIVVKWIEIATLSLVWEFRRVANHVPIVMVPSMIVVAINALFVVDGMDEDVALRSMFELVESLDVLS